MKRDLVRKKRELDGIQISNFRRQELEETFWVDFTQLNERSGTKITKLPDGRYRVRCKGQHCGLKNRNNRIYPFRVWRTHTEPGASFMQKVKARRVVGQLEHPSDGKSAMSLAAIVIIMVEPPDKDGAVFVTFETMSTPAGLVAAAFIRDKVGFGISSRGNGSVMARRGVDEVQDDFEPVTFDLVIDESTPGAEIHAAKLKESYMSLMESVGGDPAQVHKIDVAMARKAVRENYSCEPPKGKDKFLLAMKSGRGHYRAYEEDDGTWGVWFQHHNKKPRRIAYNLKTLDGCRIAARKHSKKVALGIKNRAMKDYERAMKEDYEVKEVIPSSGTAFELQLSSGPEASKAGRALTAAGFHVRIKDDNCVCVYTSYEDENAGRDHIDRVLASKDIDSVSESVGVIKAGRVLWEVAMSDLGERGYEEADMDYDEGAYGESGYGDIVGDADVYSEEDDEDEYDEGSYGEEYEDDDEDDEEADEDVGDFYDDDDSDLDDPENLDLDLDINDSMYEDDDEDEEDDEEDDDMKEGFYDDAEFEDIEEDLEEDEFDEGYADDDEDLDEDYEDDEDGDFDIDLDEDHDDEDLGEASDVYGHTKVWFDEDDCPVEAWHYDEDGFLESVEDLHDGTLITEEAIYESVNEASPAWAKAMFAKAFSRVKNPKTGQWPKNKKYYRKFRRKYPSTSSHGRGIKSGVAAKAGARTKRRGVKDFQRPYKSRSSSAKGKRRSKSVRKAKSTKRASGKGARRGGRKGKVSRRRRRTNEGIVDLFYADGHLMEAWDPETGVMLFEAIDEASPAWAKAMFAKAFSRVKNPKTGQWPKNQKYYRKFRGKYPKASVHGRGIKSGVARKAGARTKRRGVKDFQRPYKARKSAAPKKGRKRKAASKKRGRKRSRKESFELFDAEGRAYIAEMTEMVGAHGGSKMVALKMKGSGHKGHSGAGGVGNAGSHAPGGGDPVALKKERRMRERMHKKKNRMKRGYGEGDENLRDEVDRLREETERQQSIIDSMTSLEHEQAMEEAVARTIAAHPELAAVEERLIQCDTVEELNEEAASLLAFRQSALTEDGSKEQRMDGGGVNAPLNEGATDVFGGSLLTEDTEDAGGTMSRVAAYRRRQKAGR